jgi:ABC-2 type transport system permease protein
MGLALVASIPAMIQLGVAAIVPRELEVVGHHEYFGFTSIIIALFCAAVAPELTGRDQRTRTLSLYFSHSLTRDDYVTAKVAAMLSALFLVAIAPQLMLLAGNAVAGDDALDYFVDHLDQVPPILGAAALVALVFSSISLAIASQTSRRPFSTAAVLGTFVILATLAEILVSATSGDVQMYSILVSPRDVLDGAVRWMFGAPYEPGSPVDRSGAGGGLLLLASFAYVAVALAVLYRRYRRLPL